MFPENTTNVSRKVRQMLPEIKQMSLEIQQMLPEIQQMFPESTTNVSRKYTLIQYTD